MGFFGTHASSLADLNLILIMSGFLILFQAIAFVKQKNFKIHIKMANTAVVLGSLSFIWMGFSFLSHYPGSISTDFPGLIIASHVTIGLIALSTGIFFAFNKIKKTVNTMRAGFLFWTLAVFSGFLLYLNNYVL
jgi:uncharacterized membrane protein YozB (DUF420 family)